MILCNVDICSPCRRRTGQSVGLSCRGQANLGARPWSKKSSSALRPFADRLAVNRMTPETCSSKRWQVTERRSQSAALSSLEEPVPDTSQDSVVWRGWNATKSTKLGCHKSSQIRDHRWIVGWKFIARSAPQCPILQVAISFGSGYCGSVSPPSVASHGIWNSRTTSSWKACQAIRWRAGDTSEMSETWHGHWAVEVESNFSRSVAGWSLGQGFLSPGGEGEGVRCSWWLP